MQKLPFPTKKVTAQVNLNNYQKLLKKLKTLKTTFSAWLRAKIEEEIKK